MVEAYFEVAELRELLAAVIETTEIGLRLIVDDLMGADVSSLGEFLPTDFALVWTLSSVPPFVRLSSSLVKIRRQRLPFGLTFKFPS